MTKFFHQLDPRNTPLSVAQKGELAILRERILHAVMLMVSIAAIPALIVGLLELHRVPYYLLAYAIILFLLGRNLPYALRGSALLAIIYLMGILELLSSGKMSELRFYLIILVAITAVLFRYRNSIAVILLSLATLIAV